jgi:hypothetical protein
MFGNSQLSTFVSTNSALPGSEENDMVGKSDTTNSSASQLPADAVTVEDRIKRIAQCYRTIIEVCFLVLISLNITTFSQLCRSCVS